MNKCYTSSIKSIRNAFLLGFLVCSATAFSQTTNFNTLNEMHNEVPDDPYIEVNKAAMERSPSYEAAGPNYFTKQVNVDSNGNNIVGDAGNEPSIAVDPTNPDRMVIGWRQFDDVSSNFRQAGNAYSLNGGYNWVNPDVLTPGNFRSDPVLDFDSEGNLYYNSLTTGFVCQVFTISDGGQDWGAPVAAFGGDKQWMRIDRSGGVGDGNNYSYWNSSFSTCAPNNFTRSVDGSQNFESCVLVDGNPRWGTLAVDASGNLYTVGQNNAGLIVTKSTTAQNPANPVVFDFFNTVDLDGELDAGIPINPQGLLGQAWIDVDISGGIGHGNVYVCASVNRISNGDAADVMFAKSIDGGITFAPPIRINDDASESNYQWFGTMAVAPNGRIDVVWLDTRNAPNLLESVLYYSFSEDQGDSWSENKLISESFDPTIGYPNQNKMGDYFDMVSDNDYAHVAWANTLNGGQDVYYTRISPYGLLGVEDYSEANPFQLVLFPNPVSDTTTLLFDISSEEHITVTVFDLLGRKINVLLDETVFGKQSLSWEGVNAERAKLTSGLYFISIQSKTNRQTIKVLLE
ncbi:putative secreted protein (Por secretion system target) [Ulvibacter sp. MAR_2010_11]|uniref:T9SS type A sorting domain-containing protein n=1 Tax=Ulvibacter sp. MAR_2010_11 TaxID=1250229 RepID=UPI000C2BCFBF|nr:T9SS type A sorting domain-containing protein [Ulvibacter sp. MAR_2010_11]PKA84143.1 putative secreted protein (Por secretion system target) [Ulvibacter sp. MAR_2010_11]